MPGPKVAAIVQARMGSSRLPGKVLRPLAGKTVLERVVERLQAAQELDCIVIATTDQPQDAPLLELAQRLGLAAHAGPEDDVLTRYLGAAEQVGAELLVRITSDCPLIDWATVDAALRRFRAQGDLDYLSATVASGFPRGLDCEVFPLAALRAADQLATERPAREHVTLYLYQHPERFRVGKLEAPAALRHPDWRLCVDEPGDLALLEAIYDRLQRPGELLPIAAVVDLLEREPALLALNASVQQKSC